MKILYLANIRLPSEKGETLQVVKMCHAFAREKDVHLELVVPRRRNAHMKHIDPFRYYGVEQNFKITRFLTIDLMPWQTLFGSFAFRLNYWIFARLASWYAYLQHADIIYSRDWRTLHLLRNKKRNLVFELHEFREKDVWGYQSIESSCRLFVVISRGLQRALVSAGIPEEKIVVATDAVDLSEFDHLLPMPEARNTLGLSGKDVLIVYTGHLFRWKGVYTMIDAARILQEQSSHFRFVFVGGLPDDVLTLKEYTVEQEVDNAVIYGHRPYGEMTQYLAAADILVMGDSAREDISRTYTSPLKLFMYMAARRPIVASGTPAIREVLSDKNAWLFSPDDAESLAETIKTAHGHSEESSEKVQQAWEDVQKYTWEKRVKRIMNRIRT